MQVPHYRQRRSLTVLAALLTTSIAVLCLTQTAPAQVKKTPKTPEVIDNKRPLTHKDYDIWNTIQNPLISPDGNVVAYTLASPEGDSELVVRQVESGKEFRHSRGRIAGKGGAGAENKVQFSEDSARVVFTIFPPKADAGKKGDKDAPRPSLGIIEVANGKVKVIPNVRTFHLPTEGNTEFLTYHKLPAVIAVSEKNGGGGDDVDDDDDADFLQTKGKGQGKKGGDAKQPAATPQATPSDLVIHNLTDGAEAVFPNITAFSMTRDGAALVCVVAGKDDDSSGVFGFISTPDGGATKKHLVPGKAKFSRFTWDEKQQAVAFFADHSAGPKEPGKLSVYLWGRPVGKKGKFSEDSPAIEVFNSTNVKGLKDGCVLTERGGLNFSDDGSKLFVGVAPATPPKSLDPAAKGTAKDDKAVVELWHWKDDFIQPMQKARGNQDKMRTYTAVYSGKGNNLVQVADSKLPNVTLSRDGNFGFGSDDTPYRQLVAYDGNYADIYVVKTSDGSRKQILKKHHWGISFSPSGKYGIFYDGKDWNTVNPSTGSITNITAKLLKDPRNKDVKFYNEDHDSPSAAPAYGICGWSHDDRFVYIYDKYDIWEISPTGSSYHELTSSLGRREKIQLRYVKLDPKEKGIDSKKLMLLRAESLVTRESGFFALNPESTKDPTILALGPASLGVPIKAKNAFKLLLTSQSYYDFPDLYVSSIDLKQTNKVSDANPHKKDFVWGKSLLVHYKNADGVPLSGTLIVPENFNPEKKYPMIVYIYEKLSQNVHHFVLPKEGTSINPTYYASNGYLVFMPDIVYNVGYPGQSALKCVLPGIQAVIDMGRDKDGRPWSFVDENAIGIQGHSWGGYQIAYMITQTGRFKAAAAGAPVSNMTSAYDGIRWGTGMPRQFQYEKTQSRIGGSLWEFPMRFVENSPVFMADRVKTPLMMLHNDQDDAVPWYQGIEYYLALRRLGKEVYMFNYPGEKHGLGKKANKIDYTIRMQQFFDHHLKGQPAPEWMAKGIPYTPRPALKADPAGGGGD